MKLKDKWFPLSMRDAPFSKTRSWSRRRSEARMLACLRMNLRQTSLSYKTVTRLSHMRGRSKTLCWSRELLKSLKRLLRQSVLSARHVRPARSRCSSSSRTWSTRSSRTWRLRSRQESRAKSSCCLSWRTLAPNSTLKTLSSDQWLSSFRQDSS